MVAVPSDLRGLCERQRFFSFSDLLYRFVPDRRPEIGNEYPEDPVDPVQRIIGKAVSCIALFLSQKTSRM